jgi:hypothetical protein
MARPFEPVNPKSDRIKDFQDDVVKTNVGCRRCLNRFGSSVQSGNGVSVTIEECHIFFLARAAQRH